MSETIVDWPYAVDDIRSSVTLEQLGSFTSGFNARPSGRGCHGQGDVSLRDCASSIIVEGPDTPPADAFAYGPDHLTLAALMVKDVTAWRQDRTYGVTFLSRFSALDNLELE
ncbi:hypothetical protein [Litorimonas sp. WD9-15]|uniref:hypothetical protein n=1 Tax=Litorimonas sp. WD9-15 TaxID=3418716 RepID=UPI003D028B23